MKRRNTLVIIILVIVVIVEAIAIYKIKYAYSSTTTSSKKSLFNYQDYFNICTDFNGKFEPSEFTKLNSGDILTRQVRVLYEGIKLDSRKTDSVNDDNSKPSRYEFYYLNKDESTLIRVNLIYAQTQQKGMIYNSIVSPVDNVIIKEQYKQLSRPYLVDHLLGRENYLISIESMLIKPENVAKSDNEKINYLIGVDKDFYKKLESFIIENSL